MAYQIKKSKKIVEELALMDDNGTIDMMLKIEINPDRIISEYRKIELMLAKAEKAAKENNTSESAKVYGDMIITYMTLLFGDDNTSKLINYYDGRYTDMLVDVMPFINNVIRPQLEKTAKAKKELLAKNYGFSKYAIRKLG